MTNRKWLVAAVLMFLLAMATAASAQQRLVLAEMFTNTS